jgi:hypothetical protein
VVLSRKHAILRVKLRETRGLGLLLDVVARVLGIQNVKQRAPTDIELLAIREEQIVRNGALLLQLPKEGRLILELVPRRPDIFFRLTSLFEQLAVGLFSPVVLFADLRLVDAAGEDVPVRDSEGLEIVGDPLEPVNVVAG